MKSIALKLWLGMVALVMIMLLLLWLFQIVFLEKFYMSQHLSRVVKEGNAIARDVSTLSTEEYKNLIGRLADSYRARVDFIDARGGIIYSEGQAPLMHGGMQARTFNDVIGGKTVIVPVRQQRPGGTEFRLIGMPVFNKGTIAGALFIHLPIAPVKDTVFILKEQLKYITAILIGVALLLAFLLSRAFTRPIIQIDHAANRMAQGDLTVRLKPRSKDELGRLMGTMNNLAEQLSRVEQLRRDLIANVSHELRTPLSLIQGYAETIRDVSGENSVKRQKQVGIIIEETERLSKIVDDMLGLSQMQAGFSNLSISSISLRQLLERVVKKYEILSENTGVELELQGVTETLVDVDEAKLEQVLQNIVTNAFNHVSEGDRITIRLTDKAERVRVEIIDTGPGIPKEALERIWQRFYKVDGAKRNKQPGTGLGLAIVKSILEAHNSVYGVESEEGKGTVFWFELNKSIV